MERLVNVATPATASWLVVPPRIAPVGLVPSATDTLPANPVAVFPNASRAVTVTGIATPATDVTGGVVNTSWLAAAGLMVNAALVAAGRPPPDALSVYPTPTRSIASVANVATPATAGTDAVPSSVPLPGFAPIAIATLLVNPVAVLPNASRAVTTMGIAAPATALAGCVVNTSWVAAAAATLNAVLVSAMRLGAVASSVYPADVRSSTRSVN